MKLPNLENKIFDINAFQAKLEELKRDADNAKEESMHNTKAAISKLIAETMCHLSWKEKLQVLTVISTIMEDLTEECIDSANLYIKKECGKKNRAIEDIVNYIRVKSDPNLPIVE